MNRTAKERVKDAIEALNEQVEQSVSHLAECARRQCVSRSLHEDVRVERDATLAALKFALSTIDEQNDEIRTLRGVLAAPISEGSASSRRDRDSNGYPEATR